MGSYVDHAEIKLGQILTVAIALAAFLSKHDGLLVALTAIFLLSGTVRSLSPFALIYRFIVQPMGIMRSDYRLDNIQPHKFGQLVGAVTALAAFALIESGYPVVGWGVVVVLVGLTAVSYAGWCVGCFMYYQLNRLGLGGFFRHAPTDRSVPVGMRPGRDAARVETDSDR